ncbi:hypothetical protein KR018_005764 [Drosophila ironensis]|nr:hypothetical protein KR018_005764 [Drosophila ironensis]
MYQLTKVLAAFALISLATAIEFVEIGDGLYFIETKQEKNWFDAFQACRQMKANLISFETLNEWSLIDQYLWNNKIDDFYWTSGTDSANNGQHVWFSTGKPVDQDIWSPGEPNNSNGDEHCDNIGWDQTSTKAHKLNDLNCFEKKRYICELN